MARRTRLSFTRTLVLTVFVGVLLHLLHEAAHAVTAIAFGLSGTIGTNTVNYAPPVSDTAAIWTNIAGPGLMLLIAIAARAAQWRAAAIILFVVFFQRLLAGIITALGSVNDEARIGMLLGIGQWPLFALTIGVSGLLFAAQYRDDRLSAKWLLAAFIGMAIAVTAMVVGDGYLPRIAF